MKRVRAFATAALAAMVLAGCSSGGSAPAVTTAASTLPFEKMDDATFIGSAREVLDIGDEITNAEIFDLIDISCTLLSHGTTGEEIQQVLFDSGEKLSTVGGALNIIRLGVANYCPTHLSEFEFLIPK